MKNTAPSSDDFRAPILPATSLRALPWISTPKARALEKFGLFTVESLLTHLPHRYEDRRQFDSFPRDESGEAVCVCGRVEKISSRWLGGGRRMMEATLAEENAHALSGRLTLRWFNAHYVAKRLAAGMRLVVYGKPKRSGSKIALDHPEFEEIEEDADAAHSPNVARITPIHPATAGITPRELRGWIWRLLEEMNPRVLEHPLPEALARLPYAEALRQIHFPDSQESLLEARRELTLVEFFRMQLFLATRRAEYATRPGHTHRSEGRLLRAFHEQLPFPLTGAQSRAIGEIRLDLASPAPMNRMLHGDVGSGKTVVALSAMLLAVEAGSTAALMAPTQILAEQHYLNFKRWLEPLGVRVALRTGTRQEESGGGMPLFGGGELRDDAPQIVVGTHALLFGNEFPQFGLAVIDEQHKFGVLQRAKLLRGERAPDVLVMTATPIPRTLTMTLYGDLEVSTLDELPAGRGKIITAARTDEKLPDAVAFMRKHLDAGRQAYVVYPLIDESAKSEAKAASAEFEKWKAHFPEYRCELLHGRVPPEEKEAIMTRFRANESQVLVATTVIEVGVDVPNANMMLIENAERFGLAQLHQLRGRIGRGVHKSYCILIHAADTPEGEEKMATMEATANGFEIAEADLRLRGPGDLMGTAQSGLPPILIGDLLRDASLMQVARKTARALLQADPDLSAPEHRRFRLWVTAQAQRVAAMEV